MGTTQSKCRSSSVHGAFTDTPSRSPRRLCSSLCPRTLRTFPGACVRRRSMTGSHCNTLQVALGIDAMVTPLRLLPDALQVHVRPSRSSDGAHRMFVRRRVRWSNPLRQTCLTESRLPQAQSSGRCLQPWCIKKPKLKTDLRSDPNGHVACSVSVAR